MTISYALVRRIGFAHRARILICVFVPGGFLAPALISAEPETASPLTVEASRAALHEGDFALDPSLAGVHPRLLIDRRELDAAAGLWRRDPARFASLAEQRGFPELAPRPVEQAINGWELPRRVLLGASLFLLSGEAAHAETVHRWIQESYAPTFVERRTPIAMPHLGGANRDLSVGGFLGATALLHDLMAGDPAYNALYPEDLDILEASLLLQAARAYRDLLAIEQVAYEQNHFYIVATGLGLTAMTLWDRVDEFPEIRKWAVWTRNALRRTAEALSGDGFYYEAVGYWNVFFQYVVLYAEALRRMTGEDWLMGDTEEKPALFTGLDRYLAHMALPSPGKFFPYADHGPREAEYGYRFFMGDLKIPLALYALLEMAEAAPSPLVTTTIANEWRERQTYRREFVDAMEASLVLLKLPVLANHLEPDPKIADEPAWHYFSDHEVVSWRNAWTEPEARNGTALLFKNGPPEGHRAGAYPERYPDWHLGMGHAHPDAGTFQIFSRGAYFATGSGYSGQKLTAQHNCVLIDGQGQFKEGRAWGTFDTAPYSKYDALHFEDVWLASPVAAATAVVEAAYDDALGLEFYHRELIMVEGRWIVIRDRISSPDPHVYTWMLNADRPIVPIDGEANRWKSEAVGGRLIVQSLSPIDRFESGPTLVDVDLSGKRPELVARAQHLALHQAPSPHGEFLNVLCLQDRWNDRTEDFTARRIDEGMIEIREGQEICAIFLGESARMNGSYGFVRSSDTAGLLGCGFSGQGISLPGGNRLGLETAGKIVLTRVEHHWRVESDLSTEAALRLNREDGSQRILLELPAGHFEILTELEF